MYILKFRLLQQKMPMGQIVSWSSHAQHSLPMNSFSKHNRVTLQDHASGTTLISLAHPLRSCLIFALSDHVRWEEHKCKTSQLIGECLCMHVWKRAMWTIVGDFCWFLVCLFYFFLCPFYLFLFLFQVQSSSSLKPQSGDTRRIVVLEKAKLCHSGYRGY